MTFRHPTLFIAALVLLLTGCYQTLAPIQSASVTQWQKGKVQTAEQQLTVDQVAKLTTWMQNHRWGWHPVVATYAPETVVWVAHTDGTKSPIRLMRTVLSVGQSQRSLSEAESQELHAILVTHSGR